MTTVEKPPFTHGLSTTIFILIIAYLVLNFFFIGICAGDSAASSQNPVCRGLHVLTGDLSFIPLIARPTNFLELQGNSERAALVRDAYSFTWISALIFIVLIAGVTALYVRRLDDTAIKIAQTHYLNARKTVGPDQEANVSRFIWVLILFLLLNLVWGFFSFTDSPHVFMNMVHLRNRDLYMPSIFWSLLFLLALMPLLLGIRNHLMRRVQA